MSGTPSSPIPIDDNDDVRGQDVDILTPAERLRFRRRFRQIHDWAGQLHQPRSSWREWLCKPTGLGWEFWLDSFESGLPDEVKLLLARLSPPTLEELLAVGWIDEPGMGVYGKLAVADGASDLPNLLYVGFACASGGTGRWGLDSRRYQHERDWRQGLRKDTFHNRALPFKSSYNLRFVRLWIDHQQRNDMSPTDHRFIVINAAFAEFVLAKWLDGYIPTSRLSVPSRIWPEEELEWSGSLFHHCLVESWAEEDTERLAPTSTEYMALYRKGGHLAGLKDTGGQKKWVADYKARCKERRPRTAQLTEERRLAINSLQSYNRARSDNLEERRRKQKEASQKARDEGRVKPRSEAGRLRKNQKNKEWRERQKARK